MLKLGSQTNSLANHIFSRATIGQPEPVVGMGATVLGWTDRQAATIVEVFVSGRDRYVTVQEDDVKRIDKNGMSESQNYEYSPSATGHRQTFRQKERTGGWAEVTWNEKTLRWNKSEGHGLTIGRRDHYHDFSF